MQLEEFCTDVLTSLQTNVEWQRLQATKTIVAGVTWGVDPRDFLRTATRCNSFTVVQQLWAEYLCVEEHERRIVRPERN